MSSIVIALIIKFLTLLVMLFYLIPKQVAEVLRPKDWLTGLRWQILLLLIASVITSIPASTYTILRYYGTDSALLREISLITNNVSGLAIIVLLVLIFNYKRKDS
jgi:hypothetical protein